MVIKLPKIELPMKCKDQFAKHMNFNIETDFPFLRDLLPNCWYLVIWEGMVVLPVWKR
jgi:hypothetical protein